MLKPPAFSFAERKEIMLVQYKRNKKTLYYNPETLPSAGRPEPIRRPNGPFESCTGCPYAAHGFICYDKEGDCLRTDLRRLEEKRSLERRRWPDESGTQ